MASTEEQNEGTIPSTVFLWTNPRSLSTAALKCIGHIDGVEVWHEPYVACYINVLFGDPKYAEKYPVLNGMKSEMAAVGKEMEGDHIFKGGNLRPGATFTYESVKKQLSEPLPENTKVRFIKDIPSRIIDNYDVLPDIPVKHTFIIRHPNRSAISYRNCLMHVLDHKGDPDDFDIGDRNPFIDGHMLSWNPLYKMYNYVRQNIEPNPIIIDADDLQNHPEEIMTKYCKAVGIPFEKKHLQWDKSIESLKYFHGPLEQMVFGEMKHVYDAAFLSSSFLPIKNKIPETVPAKCQIFADVLADGYDEMYENRLKPTN